MRVCTRLFISLALLVGVGFGATLGTFPQSKRRAPSSRKSAGVEAARDEALRKREEAYRANNLGVALLEQFKHREGAEAFRRALSLNPRLDLARINLAIALYNLPDLEGALREAQEAARLAPRSPQARYMLGLVARAQNRFDDALAEFRRVLEIDPRDTGANINLGQLLAQRRDYAAAIPAFRAALADEPYNGTALYNLATALLRKGEREEGSRLIERFQTLRESGAATSIGQNYLEQGRYAEAVASTGLEAELVERSTPDVNFAFATGHFMMQAQALLYESSAPRLTLTEARRRLAASLGGNSTLFDFDSDGDLDLFEVEPFVQRLYQNDGAGRLRDVTRESGIVSNTQASGAGLGAVAGDYDNDGKPDLFVLRYGASALYRNEGGGRFREATADAKIPAYPYLSISAAFVDIDHDNDLDIFIAGLADLSKLPAEVSEENAAAIFKLSFPGDFASAPNLLLRNDGNGTFVDNTEAAKLSGSPSSHAVAVVPTDYDNRRDIDLLVVNHNAPHALYRNLRDGTFQDVADEVGLNAPPESKNFQGVAAGDYNKDGYTDFLFEAGDGASLFARSDGRGRFVLEADSSLKSNAPMAQPASASQLTSSALAFASQPAQFVDYDNDGLLDVVSVSPRGLRVRRNLGDSWVDVSARAARPSQTSSVALSQARLTRTLASGDLDADGDTDLVLRAQGGDLVVARNEGDARLRSLSVRLSGKVSNRSAVGAKIEARAGSLRQKLETYSTTPAPAPADIVFGLGQRTSADALRVIWPAGIVQAETEIPQASSTSTATTSTTPVRSADARRRSSAPVAPSLTITEIDRKPSSCPYLFAWNGERFEFITDFMGGGELGYWQAPGVRAVPDPDEYVRIRGDQLRPRNGRYELRVTNELEEALFIDRLQLLAVAHPRGLEVYPNEGLGNPTSAAFRLYAARSPRPPLAATDEHGHDVLPALTRLDRTYPDDFRLLPIRGYADEHTLTLTLEQHPLHQASAQALQASAEEHPKLLLTGWTDYAFSSDNVAAAQSGRALSPPALQVKDAQGRWQTVIPNIGIPVGRPQTVVLDLEGKFLSESRDVRIVTNMRIYWDQILFDTSGGDFPAETARLDPSRAELRWRGFSAETTPDGREPFAYDYARTSPTSLWKTFPGRYTREGDVRELLASIDDIFVVSRPGDELALSFDANALPPLPRGWTRTFLLYADGFSKEMDINSASPHTLAPLPFHAMKSYPYAAPEAYPSTPAHRAYLERYNTRLVAEPVSKW
ncbi:MAG TPA: FG-GAP-like repeat-containing protein [Pyrinomonadaceae bacterium]|jgi:tetratricopeptide (TPR) repeat protein